MVRVGQFVRIADGSLGIGKVTGQTSDGLEVEYFDSISPTGRHGVTAGRSQVEPVQISLQQRCYWHDDRGWRVGRVVWQGESEYGVRPPDSDFDLRIPEAELYVRWSKPLHEPTEVLIAGGNESPYFHHCRQPFVASTVAQRAASHGMHAVLSAVIELHEHQLEVVRRVLEDPVQRYLLADEVGLGKTIEAGLIIRQYLLDHPYGHVVVITPPLLRRQWVSELREKFLIDDFQKAVISILSHDNPQSWAGGTRNGSGEFRLHSEAGLLVVDEVHNLAALAERAEDESSPYAALAQLATTVPRLLLLSATPLLNNEHTFLAMLHLLDPDIYPLDDVEGFRHRVRDRQALGTAFFTFRHDIPSFLLREKLKTLRDMFSEDDQLGLLLDRVEEASEDKRALREAVSAARIHISEAYRVHRRLLRTRRTDTVVARFPVCGRTHPRPFAAPEPGDCEAEDWVEDWRDYVRSRFSEGGGTQERAAARTSLVAFAERAVHPPLLRNAAAYRLRPDVGRAHKAELTAAQQDALRFLRIDDVERGILNRAAHLSASPLIVPSLRELLLGEQRLTVIFTTFTAHAKSIHDELAKYFGYSAVATHLLDGEPADVENGLDQFKDPTANCWILICDRSAEEGRNLQFADQAVHLDVPLSPNRLEQRIGRLDRYGHGPAIPTFWIEWPQSTITGAWARCLASGFGVFDQSIASLQFAIDRLLPQAFDALLDDGPLGLTKFVPTLPNRRTGRARCHRGFRSDGQAIDKSRRP